MSLRLWYMRAVKQFGWSKLELLAMIENEAHKKIVLVEAYSKSDNETNIGNVYANKATNLVAAGRYFHSIHYYLIQEHCRGKPRIEMMRTLKFVATVCVLIRSYCFPLGIVSYARQSILVQCEHASVRVAVGSSRIDKLTNRSYNYHGEVYC